MCLDGMPYFWEVHVRALEVGSCLHLRVHRSLLCSLCACASIPEAVSDMSRGVALRAGIGNCFARVTREQGIYSFWRGNLANVIRCAPLPSGDSLP